MKKSLDIFLVLLVLSAVFFSVAARATGYSVDAITTAGAKACDVDDLLARATGRCGDDPSASDKECSAGAYSVDAKEVSAKNSEVAETRSQDPADTTRVLDESIVVDVRRQDRFLETIPSQTLKGPELERLNSFSVADALRYFAGVQLKDYGGIGGLKTVNIRSMGTNHVGVFYDGIQLGNAQNGQVDLGRYSLDDVEEISLHNGQKSDIFQSAKDFGTSGSIYIRTRIPKFAGDKRFNLKAAVKTGSFGLVNPSVRTEFKISDKVTSSLSGEWVNATGRYKFRRQGYDSQGNLAYDTTAWRHNGDVSSFRVEGALHGYADKGSWNVRAYVYRTNRGIPGAIVSNVYKTGERLRDFNTFIQGSATRVWIPSFRSMLNAKYSYDYTMYENKDSRVIPVKNRYRQHECYLSLANLYEVTSHFQVSLAYDFQWNTMDAYYYLPIKGDGTFPYPTRFTHLVSFAAAYEYGRFRVQGSLLESFVHEKVKRFSASPDKSVLSPGLFGSFRMLRQEQLYLRAFCKRSFRMPTFNDLYYTDFGNASLKPEYTFQTDVGLKYEKKFNGGTFLHGLDASADMYWNKVTDKIIAYPKGQQFRWTMMNLGKVDIRGIDVAVNCHIRVGRVDVMPRLQYTYQKAVDVTNKSDFYYGHQIPYIPWHSGTAVLSAMWKGWALNYIFIYTGERYHQQENIPANYTEPWYTSDMSLQKDFNIRTVRCKAVAEINNIFGQDYEVIRNYPMPKTNFRITLSVEL